MCGEGSRVGGRSETFELFLNGFGVGDGGPGRERKQVIVMEQNRGVVMVL